MCINSLKNLLKTMFTKTVTKSPRLLQRNNKQNYSMIGAALGWGAQIKETYLGPRALYEFGIIDKLSAKSKNIEWVCTIDSPIKTELSKLDLVTDHCERLALAVEQIIAKGNMPVIVGGDHSIAMGSWSGVINAHNAQQNFGLIWIDAHMDANTPETTPSNAYHGMPVAALLGYGENKLVNIRSFSPKIKPDHIILIAIRSYEVGEQAFLENHGVKIYYIDEVKARGFKEVYKEAIETLSKRTKHIGITIDLDAFDPVVAPGVGSPEPMGLVKEDVLPYLSIIKSYKLLSAIEITEYNPTLDHDHKTASLIEEILIELLE